MFKLHRTPVAAVSLKLAWLPVSFANKPKKYACFAFCHSCDKTPQLQSCSGLVACHRPPFRTNLSLPPLSFSLWEAGSLRGVSGTRVTPQTRQRHHATGRRGTVRPRARARPCFGGTEPLPLGGSWTPGECPIPRRARVAVGGGQTGVVGTLLLERTVRLESVRLRGRPGMGGGVAGGVGCCGDSAGRECRQLLETTDLSFIPTQFSQSRAETGSLTQEGRSKLDVTLCVYVTPFPSLSRRLALTMDTDPRGRRAWSPEVQVCCRAGAPGSRGCSGSAGLLGP